MSLISRTGQLSALRVVYLANLLVSFHYYLVVYINSPLLSEYLADKYISGLYIVGSILAAVLCFYFTRLLRREGNHALIYTGILLEAGALIGLAYFTNPLFVAVAFLMFLVISPVIYVNLDIFLERCVRDEGVTGSTRGAFLTMMNVAQVASPLLAAFLLRSNEYQNVYLVSVGFLLLALGVIIIFLPRTRDYHYEHTDLRHMLGALMSDRGFYNAFISQFFLRFFYAWMVIYTPLYLYQTVGFSLMEIGELFTIMLIPFLVLELPLGRMSDTRLSERGMMRIGFALMFVTVALIPFISASSFILWAAILFVSRIGASFTEVASESYFFKHVDARSATMISFFRMARPVTYVAAAVVASLTLIFVPIQWSFMVLALCMAVGLFYTASLPERKVAQTPAL